MFVAQSLCNIIYVGDLINLINRSPKFQTCHRQILSPTSLTNSRYQFENISKFNFTIDVEGVNDNPPEIFGASKLITLIKGIQNRFKLNLTDADGDDVGVTIVSGSQFGRFVKGKVNGKEVNAFNNTDDDIYFFDQSECRIGLARWHHNLVLRWTSSYKVRRLADNPP